MPTEIKEWLGVFALFISICGTIYAWITRSSKVAIEQISSLEQDVKLGFQKTDEKIDAIRDRVIRIEIDIENFPDKDSLHKMQLDMQKICGAIEVLSEQIKQSIAISNRIQEYWLEQSKRDLNHQNQHRRT